MKHCGTVPIQTERLLLRQFTEQDIPYMYQNWASNPAVTRCLVWAAHRSQEETRAVVQGWLRQYKHKDFYEWAIVEKSSGLLIGSIGLVRDPDRHTSCEVGYCLGEAWWNCGYATEALQAVLALAVKVGYRLIYAKHAIENPASGRVMQKAGMSMRIGETMTVSTANGLFDCFVYEYRPAKAHHLFW